MKKARVRAPKAMLIAVDGVDPSAIVAAARVALGSPSRGGISKWDASGVFQELAVADEAAGAPSPRTLLLLYAADLAFRLRWAGYRCMYEPAGRVLHQGSATYGQESARVTRLIAPSFPAASRPSKMTRTFVLFAMISR